MTLMAQIESARKSEIEAAVEQLRLDTGLTYPENTLLEFAKELKVDVLDLALPDHDGKKVKAFIGLSTIDEVATDGSYAFIYLHSDLSEEVKNFTLAHELGHFLLHRSEIDGSRIDYQSFVGIDDPKKLESEANYFAACLLMPKGKLEASIRFSKSLDDVAKGFGVSRPAVESRIRGLGWVLM